MNFGETIKTLRKKHRFSQRDLAEQLNVDCTYISKIESGNLDILPSEDLIRRMAKILNSDAEVLLDLAGKLDLKRLQQIAREIPEAAVILRRIQENKLTTEQWQKIKEIVEDCEQ